MASDKLNKWLDEAGADAIPVPPELKRYLRDPVPEKYTVEIFEDMHAVVDRHLVELARLRGVDATDEKIIQEWEQLAQEKIEKKQASMQERYGSRTPFAFLAYEEKLQFLVSSEHPEYGSGQLPGSVVEVTQEFLEILTYRDELDE